MNDAILVQKLQKSYITAKGGVKEALCGIDLNVPEGSFFGLLGPNGAGKSTLINIMAGLVVKTSGKVSISGHDLDTDVRQAKQAIGIVPQELILDPFFTPRQVLENMAGFYGVRKKDRRTDEIIAAVGLTDKANAAARSLSGGMRRRLLVAKALVHSPKILVLDEPTAGVDVELREQLWAYVKRLNQQGTTVLLTTHYLEEAQQLCDWIAVIDRGSIIANDKKRNLMKILDHKKLIITPTQPLEIIPEIVMRWNSKINGAGQLEIDYKAKEVSVQDILSSVFDAGISIQDISTQEASLEDVFKHLTKRPTTTNAS